MGDKTVVVLKSNCCVFQLLNLLLLGLFNHDDCKDHLTVFSSLVGVLGNRWIVSAI